MRAMRRHQRQAMAPDGAGVLGCPRHVATNVPAQIVALLTGVTGVTGASIFPLLPPAPPVFPPTEEATRLDSTILVCDRGGAPGSVAESWCGVGSAA